MDNNVSKSVKISESTYRRLWRIASREQRSLSAVIDRAVVAYEQAVRLEKAALRRRAL
jgi:predicted transcriptional regulator